MPPPNSRYSREDIRLSGIVAEALGYKARLVKANKYAVTTIWGPAEIVVRAKTRRAAIETVAPAFTECHETPMLNWLGRQAVYVDFEFKFNVEFTAGEIPAHWRIVIRSEFGKKTFRSPSLKFPAARPLAQAVAYVYRKFVRS